MSQKSEQRDPVLVDHHRQLVCSAFILGEPDEDGARLLTVRAASSPDAWVFRLPGYVVESMKESLNSGITVASPGDLSKITKD